jgi:hypothetical protein
MRRSAIVLPKFADAQAVLDEPISRLVLISWGYSATGRRKSARGERRLCIDQTQVNLPADVSRKLTPRSSARRMVAIDSAAQQLW